MEVASEVRAKVTALAWELAREEGEKLAAPGSEFGSPLEALEVRAAAIGDLLMREVLAEAARARHELATGEAAVCPGCGGRGRPRGTRRRGLQTIRGPVEVPEHEYHCPSCRRSFFPDDGLAGRGAGQSALAAGDAKGGARGGRGEQL